VPDQVRSLESESRGQLGEVLGERADVERRDLGRLPVAAQVDRDDVEPLGQGRDQRIPGVLLSVMPCTSTSGGPDPVRA